MSPPRRRLSQFLTALSLKAASRLTDATSQHIATVLIGHLLRLGLGLISSAILARGLGAAGLNTFSVLGAAMMIAITVGDFGLSNSAIRYVAADRETEPERAPRTASIFATLKLLAILVVVAASLLLAEPIVALLNLPSERGPGLVRLAALGVLATSASGIVSTILQVMRRFTQLVATQTLNISLTVLLMGALYMGGRLTVANALVVGAVTALAAALLGWRLIPAGWRPAFGARASIIGRETRRLWKFGRWLWISTTLVIVLSQLDLLLLNRLVSPRVSGHYALALNLALKAEVLNQTLHTVLLPNVSGLAGKQQFAAYARQSLLRSGLLATLLLLFLPVAGPFIRIVYGVEYAPSIPFFYLLIGVAVFDVLLNPLLLLAYPLNMSRHIAGSQVVRLAAMLFAGFFLIPIWGGSGAALAKLVARVSGALFLGGLILLRLRGEKMQRAENIT